MTTKNNENKKHELLYKMGNPGDIIKHGLLAEFVAWWGKNEQRQLVYADTFAGRPHCGGVAARVCPRTIELFRGMDKTAISRVYKNETRYLGSACLVREVARNTSLNAKILASDASPRARCELRNEGGIDVMDLPHCHDGYTVLDDEVRRKRAGGANLILIDPYDGFLRDECNNGNCRLQKAKALMGQNVSVALFVLDMWSQGDREFGRKWDIHRNYCQFKQSHLNGLAVSLRCVTSKKYDAEVLLISKIFAEDGGEELRGRLRRFKKAVQQAAKLGKMSLPNIDFWPQK